MDEYVGNSHKQQAEQKKKAEKVISGKVESKNESTGIGKFLGNFFVNDAADIFDYAWNELILPGIKNSILDTIEMAMYDRRGGYGGRSRGGDRYYDYNRSYDRRDRDRRERERERDRRRDDDRYRDRDLDRNPGRPKWNDIVLSFDDAEKVLRDMRDTLDEYDVVSLGDLYGFIGYGEETDHTDFSYGWYSLRDAGTQYVSRDRYLLKLPKPKPID